VWYHQREGGFHGARAPTTAAAPNNSITVGRPENLQARSARRHQHPRLPGRRIHINAHYFLATKGGPVPISVKVEKINPTVDVIAYENFALDRMGEEKTALRFKTAANGNVLECPAHGRG